MLRLFILYMHYVYYEDSIATLVRDNSKTSRDRTMEMANQEKNEKIDKNSQGRRLILLVDTAYVRIKLIVFAFR